MAADPILVDLEGELESKDPIIPEVIMEYLKRFLDSRRPGDFEQFWQSLMNEYSADYKSLPPAEKEYPACPPNHRSKQETRRVLDRLTFMPSTVVPCASGGVGICFASSNKYADIQCLNSGSVIGVTSDRRGDVRTFKLKCLTDEEVDNAISHIVRFLEIPAMQYA